MRRSYVLCAALLGLLLAACAPANTPIPAPTSAVAPANTPIPAPTSAVAQATPTPQSEAAEPATAVSQPEATKPVATPDIDKVLNTQPDDWKLGPDGAKVTIIEWGDFQ